MLALSSKPWLGWVDLQGRFSLAPASYEALEHAAPFRSEQCPEGMVASCGNTLRVLAAERLGESFNAASEKLRYTPRELTVHPDLRTIAIVEADQSCVPFAQREGPEGPAGEQASGRAGAGESRADAMDADGDADADSDDESALTPAEQFGAPKAPPGAWASCVRVVDPRAPPGNQTKQIVELDSNEAALCACHAYFPAADELFLVVGSVVGLTFAPRDCAGGFLSLYTYDADGRIALKHKTPVDGCPGAVCAFKGRLLAGVGSALRVYEFGKKKLLRKAECGPFPNFVTTVHAAGDRAYVGDVAESFFFVRYDARDGSLFVAADDNRPRHVTAATPLDYDTIAGGDKFGNVFVNRLTADVSKEMEDDPTGGKNAQFNGKLNGARLKTACAAQFHVGETVCALTKGTLVSGGKESLLYASLNGTLGALAPFASRDDVDFCTHLEMHMRQEAPPLLGRDHLSFRGAYAPVKDVVDGDLCEQFAALDAEARARVAEDMDHSVGEILKRLEDLRAAIV